MQDHVTEILLWRMLAMFLSIGAGMGIVLGLLLIVKPAYFECVNRIANRWISLRRLSLLFDRSVKIEHFFYRHHRVIGLGITFSAIYLFVYFGALFDKAQALYALADILPAPFLAMFLDTLVLSLLVGGAAVLVVGVFLWMRPSLLRGLEEEVNQWVSSRQATKFLDVSHDMVEVFVARHLRRVGWLLLLSSVYLLFLLFHLLV
ncbi:MAG: hypothetical protein WAO71_09415 [Gallionella sp.]